MLPPGKADVRFDALSADMAEKNKLVDKVSDLQKKTAEVRASPITNTFGRCVTNDEV